MWLQVTAGRAPWPRSQLGVGHWNQRVARGLGTVGSNLRVWMCRGSSAWSLHPGQDSRGPGEDQAPLHAPGAEGWLPRVHRASPSSVVRLGLIPVPPPPAHSHMAGAAREGSTVPSLGLQASPLGSGWSCARSGAQRSRCPAAVTSSEGQWAPVRALSPAWRH